MNILFVNSDRFGSKVIQYGTQENMSHVGISFHDHAYIYHAIGSKIVSTLVQDFFDSYNLIDHVEVNLPQKDEEKILNFFTKSIWYQGYDYSSIIYFVWDRIKARVFGTKQAKVNPMNRNDDMICTEVVYIVDDAYQKVTGKYLLPENIDLSITKPGQLCEILKSRF